MNLPCLPFVNVYSFLDRHIYCHFSMYFYAYKANARGQAEKQKDLSSQMGNTDHSRWWEQSFGLDTWHLAQLNIPFLYCTDQMQSRYTLQEAFAELSETLYFCFRSFFFPVMNTAECWCYTSCTTYLRFPMSFLSCTHDCRSSISYAFPFPFTFSYSSHKDPICGRVLYEFRHCISIEVALP